MRCFDSGKKSQIASVAMMICGLFVFAAAGLADESTENPYSAWRQGPPARDDYFPIVVWLQQPANAPKFKAAGINLYVALWQGPTEAQLAELKRHGMPVICNQNEIGLKHKDDPTIVGWMHGDEPDNAQFAGRNKGYDPPIPPAQISEDYHKLKAADPSRPILLNLGQGVAWDSWYGRGVRTNHPEDYPEYAKGSDIVSFDIYPGCHSHADVVGKLWLVADGVSRLRKSSGDRKPVWTCIECTHIDNPNAKATPRQVRAEVWMSLVRGSRGIIYFVHQFKPEFIEAGLLADREMLAAVTETNRQIQRLAPVLNSPTVPDAVSVETTPSEVPVEAIVKRHSGASYVFAVAMRPGKTAARLHVAGLADRAKVEVLGESRELIAADGTFLDAFESWDVHIYKLPN